MDIEKQLDAGLGTIILAQGGTSFAIGMNKFLVFENNLIHAYNYEEISVRSAAEAGGERFVTGYAPSDDLKKVIIEAGGVSYELHEDTKGNLMDFLEQLSLKKSSRLTK